MCHTRPHALHFHSRPVTTTDGLKGEHVNVRDGESRSCHQTLVLLLAIVFALVSAAESVRYTHYMLGRDLSPKSFSLCFVHQQELMPVSVSDSDSDTHSPVSMRDISRQNTGCCTSPCRPRVVLKTFPTAFSSFRR